VDEILGWPTFDKVLQIQRKREEKEMNKLNVRNVSTDQEKLLANYPEGSWTIPEWVADKMMENQEKELTKSM